MARFRSLRHLPWTDRSDLAGNAELCGVVGERAGQGEIFLRCGGAENRLGELTVALVAPRGELSMQAAAAGLLMGGGRREHVLFFAAKTAPPIERRVPGASAGSPYGGWGLGFGIWGGDVVD